MYNQKKIYINTEFLKYYVRNTTTTYEIDFHHIKHIYYSFK